MSSVKRSVVTGFVWQFVALLGQRLVVFVAYIFFGRSLSKAEIGVVAVATSITVFVDMLRAGGILQALIQHPNDETEVRAVSSTFWMTFFAGLGWSIVLLGIGMLLPGITGSPRIGPIMMVLASTAFMDNLRLVPMAVLSRKLRFSRRALADTIGSVCGAIVGIAALFVFEQQIRSGRSS